MVNAPNLETGGMLRHTLAFALPVAATGMLQTLFNAVDMMVVGRFASSSALAAVGSSGTLVKLLIGCFQGLTVGADILLARRVGSGDEARLRQALHCVMAMAMVLGVAIAAVGLGISGWLLELVETPPELMEAAAGYFRLYILGLPAQMVYQFGSAALRARGDPKRPLCFLLCSGMGHIAMNLLLVAWLRLGVTGAGLAACVTQYVSAGLILVSLSRERGAMHLELRSLRIFRAEAAELLRVGFPAGLQAVIFKISDVTLQGAVNALGETVIAANTAASNVDGLIYTAMNAVSFAASTLTSRQLGAGKHGELGRIFRSCTAAVLLIGLPMSLLAYGLNGSLLGLFVSGDDPAYGEILRLGAVRLAYIGLPYVLCGLMESFGAMVRGMGYSWLPMLVSILGVCGVRIAWIYTVFPLHPTLERLYLCYPLSWLFTMAVHFVCFVCLSRKSGLGIPAKERN